MNSENRLASTLPSPTGSSFEPNMANDSPIEAPSGSHSERSESDLLEWEKSLLEKIELLTAEFHKLRDMYRESLREILLLQFELSMSTQVNQARDSGRALMYAAPIKFTSGEFDHAELKKFAGYLLAPPHADDKKRADGNEGKKE